jgi:hypothetical protein
MIKNLSNDIVGLRKKVADNTVKIEERNKEEAMKNNKKPRYKR